MVTVAVESTSILSSFDSIFTKNLSSSSIISSARMLIFKHTGACISTLVDSDSKSSAAVEHTFQTDIQQFYIFVTSYLPTAVDPVVVTLTLGGSKNLGISVMEIKHTVTCSPSSTLYAVGSNVTVTTSKERDEVKSLHSISIVHIPRGKNSSAIEIKLLDHKTLFIAID